MATRIYWTRMPDGSVCIRNDEQTYAEYDTGVELQTMIIIAGIGGIELIEEPAPPAAAVAETGDSEAEDFLESFVVYSEAAAYKAERARHWRDSGVYGSVGQLQRESARLYQMAREARMLYQRVIP